MVLFLDVTLPSATVSEPSISNMDKAVMIQDSTFDAFEYFLFGTKGKRILMVFSIKVQTTLMNLIEDAIANDGDIISEYEAAFYGAMLTTLASFFVFAFSFKFISTLGELPSLTAPAPSGVPSDEELVKSSMETSEITNQTEMQDFASEWALLVPLEIPGYETSIIIMVSGIFLAALIIKLKRKKKVQI